MKHLRKFMVLRHPDTPYLIYVDNEQADLASIILECLDFDFTTQIELDCFEDELRYATIH